MILIRNRFIFGLIKNAIKTVFTVIIKVFQLFNLQWTLLVGLIGIVLFITGAFEQNPTALLVFRLLLIATIVYAIVGWIRRALGLETKNKTSKGIQIIKHENKCKNNKEVQKQEVQEEKTTKVVEQVVVKEQAPTYYRVKNHPDYVMAEYVDRYELYKKTQSGLKKIRTDYKQGE